VRRVSVVGASGSGKTTVGRVIASTLGVPFHELDAHSWRAGWVPEEPERFRAQVTDLVRADAWVIDGNYTTQAQDLVWGRADTVVWLDLPRPVVLLQIVLRTAIRALLRRELWQGNRESLAQAFSRRSIVLWSWHQHPRLRRRYGATVSDTRWGGLRIVRLRSRRQVRRFLASCRVPERPGPGR
jgi:adenylate kinase family enzyme